MMGPLGFTPLNIFLASLGALVPLGLAIAVAWVARKRRRRNAWWAPVSVLVAMAVLVTIGFLCPESYEEILQRIMGYAHVEAVFAWIVELAAGIVLIFLLVYYIRGKSPSEHAST